MAEQSESIKKAVVTLRQLSEEEKIRLQCEARERYHMDWQSSMRTSREQGRAEGRVEGITVGREQERANTKREKERAKREKERADQAELLNTLTGLLIETGRLDDCKKALKDIEYRKQLMKEYKIG